MLRCCTASGQAMLRIEPARCLSRPSAWSLVLARSRALGSLQRDAAGTRCGKALPVPAATPCRARCCLATPKRPAKAAPMSIPGHPSLRDSRAARSAGSMLGFAQHGALVARRRYWRCALSFPRTLLVRRRFVSRAPVRPCINGLSRHKAAACRRCAPHLLFIPRSH